MGVMNSIKYLPLIAFLFVFCDFSPRVLGIQQANVPPRGWNSYDSFCWTISEDEFLQNAVLVAQRLRFFGYEYAVLDYLWYRKKVEGANVDSLGFDVIDEWGRVIPDPGRWPSSEGGIGLSEVANKVHELGLKFGIHVMRGISTQAVNANTPILDVTTGKAYEESGRKWHAKDIGLEDMKCGWMQNGFMSVNTDLGAGRAFLRSLYQQYADWGVDFVKHDCVFGDDLNINEIKFVSQILNDFSRPILYSLSPGTSGSPNMAKDINGLVNMYRVTGDDWDTWGDVSSHFNVARDFAAANMIGANGLKGKSWPDLDMLPLGWLTDPGTNDGPHRKCRLSLDEQRTQMTLWSMAKSPLMYGGDMRNLDETTFSFITNPTLLKINSFSSNNMEFPNITGAKYHEFRRHALANQVENYKVVQVSESEDRFLGMTSCSTVNANGWSAEAYDDELEKVCWKNLPSEQDAPFCLYKKKLLLESDESTRAGKNSWCKLHPVATERRQFCLGVSSNRKLTSKEFRRGYFSSCKQDANQMWELSRNATLKNSYSGLCAMVKAVKANEGGVRSWIARGTEGEIYLAFFNLNSEAQTISAEISDIGKALPGGKVYSECRSTELWSGKDNGVVSKTISMVVQPHGCALFTLLCI